MNQPQKVDQRVMRAAHYVICHTEASSLGATKLNKVLWNADVNHYRRFGRTVTGLTDYVRMQFGPVPIHIGDALRALTSSGAITERSVSTPVGNRREFVWLTRQDADGFQPSEVEALHTAIDEIIPLSANGASEGTHDVLWEELANGELLPIRAASVNIGTLEPDELDWALTAGTA